MVLERCIAGAADTVMTLIDKASDQSPEAYFYKVALGQTDAGAFKERSVQGPLYFVDTNSHCLHNWTQSGEQSAKIKLQTHQ